jgi:hypothetical protein
MDKCRTNLPPLAPVAGAGREVACLLYDKTDEMSRGASV